LKDEIPEKKQTAAEKKKEEEKKKKKKKEKVSEKLQNAFIVSNMMDE
jgi:hypothetical protein